MPRILSRSHMPSAAAARRRSSTASSSVRQNSLVDYSTGPRSPHRQQQQHHRQRPRRHSTETYGLPPPEAVAVPLTVQSARNQPQNQQYESSTSFATAMTTSTQRTTQSVPTDFPSANIAAHNINSTTSSGKPSSWQGVSPPSSGSSSAAWSFGLGTSAPSVGTTSTAYSGISSLSSSPGRGIGAGSDAVGAENTSRANPRSRKPRRSRRHSADTVLDGGGFLPAPLKRNLSNDYGHFLEVAEEI